MKKIFKITIILFALIVLPFSFSNYALIQATSAHDLQEKKDIFIYDVPTFHAEKMSIIQQHFKVIGLVLKNNWPSVASQLDNNFAYASKGKKKKSFINSTTTKKISSGLLPKVGHSYTYEPSFQGPEKKTYVATKNPYFDNAVNLLEDEYTGYTYIESSKSFALGVAYSDVFYFSLDYPMIAKAMIRDTDYGIDKNDYTNVAVVSTTATVHTKAGTFKNVVELTYPNGSTLYIAKCYGIIKITDYEGNTSTELIAVQDI